MKIKEAIDGAYAVRPDVFSPEQKVNWLNYLDGQLYLETILTHENPEGLTFSKYSPSDLEKELLVPFPYDRLYLSYLQMKAAEAYGEEEDHNSAAYLFNQEMKEFKAQWNRTHRHVNSAPKSQRPCGTYFVYPCDSPLERKESE